MTRGQVLGLPCERCTAPAPSDRSTRGLCQRCFDAERQAEREHHPLRAGEVLAGVGREDVLVFRFTSYETARVLAESLADVVWPESGAPLIVVLGPAESLERLSEDSMRAAGWVRAEQRGEEDD